MKYVHGLLCFLCSCTLLLSASTESLGQNNLATYDAIKFACAADSQHIGFAKEKDEEAHKLTNAMNGLFLSEGMTKESFTFEQMLTYLDKGYAINKEKKLGLKGPKVTSFIALGAGADYKALNSICQAILITKSQEKINGYAETFEFPPYSANLTAAKGAKVSSEIKQHVSRWTTQYPIYFTTYVNKTGYYAVEIEYSKNKEKTSNAPLKVYAATGLDKESLAKASQISEVIPSTADKSWTTFKSHEFGLLYLEAGKKYYLMLADAKMNSENKKEVMALHKLKLKGAIGKLLPKPYDDSFDALSHACRIDGYDFTAYLDEYSKEEQAERLQSFAGRFSGLFIKAGVTNKNITREQMLSYKDKGFKKYLAENKVGYGDGLNVYEYIAMGAGFNLKKLEKICAVLNSARRENYRDGYSITLRFPAATAHLDFTKGARYAHEGRDPAHVSNWMSNYPVIFKTYIDETGEYEVEINYSKSQKSTSNSPLFVYAIKGDRNSPKSGDVFVKAKIPATANNWSTYKKLNLGKLRLQAGNFYTFYLADDEINKKRKKNVMALHEMTMRLK